MTLSQSSISALGANFLNSLILSSLDMSICWMEYLIKGIFLALADYNVTMLFNLICLKKSVLDPFFKILGPIAANGPNSKTSFPFIYRLSKCGTVIGGVPSG